MRKLINLLIYLSLVLAANAQYGDISGKIRDERGEGLAFAKVLLLDSLGTGTLKGVTSDADGNYTIQKITPGKYNLQFFYERKGAKRLAINYIPQTVKGVIVSDNKVTFTDAQLRPEPKPLK